MAPSSPLFCLACGTANQRKAMLCGACGQPLAKSAADTAFVSEDTVSASPALLAGRYRIIDTVGKGGSGAVYKAADVHRHDSLVAIKSANLSGLSPQDVLEATVALHREARLLSGLTHPNLPRVYEHFTDGEHWYLTMDLIEGETLEAYLNRTQDGYLPVEEVLEIGVQLCDVLNYLHTRQPPIIFHEVKPATIMHTPGGQLYLINFGIARHFTPGQARDMNAPGTADYAASEQDSRAQAMVQADISSLGATLHYLLTGKDPSESTSSKAAPDGQDRQEATLLEHFFMQMIKQDADKRPESMNVVKRVLLQIQLVGLLYEREALLGGSVPSRVLPARRAPQRPESAILSFIGKALCSIGIHQGEWTRIGKVNCQQTLTCIFCGKPQFWERHNWSSQWEYVKEGSCETRVTCLDCGKTKSGYMQHEVPKHSWESRCKRCGAWLD